MNVASLLVLLCAALFPAEGEDAALVAEFRRYYGDKQKTSTMRREAVLTLAGVHSLGAAQALALALEDAEFAVRRAAIDTLAGMQSDEGARWLAEGVLGERKHARNARLLAGAAESLGGMGSAFAYDALVPLLAHRDQEARLGAVAGLGRLKDSRACPLLVPLVAGADAALAIAALDALMGIGASEAAEPAVLGALASSHKSLRIKAISVALALRVRGAIRPLILMLDEEPDPRVSEDAYKALKGLTLRDFSDKSADWLPWWDRNESSWQMPDLVRIAEARKRLATTGGLYAVGSKTFQEIETKSDNILFAIDVSQSMSEPFADPERLARSGRSYASVQRLEIVKEELIHTIESLTDSTQFNVIAFASDVKSWKPRATRANVLNKSSAVDWVRKLVPLGGAAASFRARTGLDTPASEEGMTNTYLALMTAFGEEVERKRGSTFVLDTKDPIDTIFFLTDGEPTTGRTVDMGEIRSEVRRVNAFRGVQLHVIYVGGFGGKDFQYLAEENGGIFVSIGG